MQILFESPTNTPAAASLTESAALFEDLSEAALAENLEREIHKFTKFVLGEALLIGRKLNSFKKRLLSKYGKKDGAKKYNRWVKEKLTNFFCISANLAQISAGVADFYFSLDNKTRRLIRSKTQDWSLSALKELKKVPHAHLEALIKAGRQTSSSIKQFIKSLQPKSYLISGQPFSPEDDSELLTRKYNLSEETLAAIISLAQAIAANREDPTMLTDDIISALSEAGYDTAVILPPPPKPTKREVKAALEKAEHERAEALSLVKQLELELEALRQQINSSTLNGTIVAAISSKVDAQIQVEHISVLDSNESNDLLDETVIETDCLEREEIDFDAAQDEAANSFSAVAGLEAHTQSQPQLSLEEKAVPQLNQNPSSSVDTALNKAEVFQFKVGDRDEPNNQENFEQLMDALSAPTDSEELRYLIENDVEPELASVEVSYSGEEIQITPDNLEYVAEVFFPVKVSGDCQETDLNKDDLADNNNSGLVSNNRVLDETVNVAVSEPVFSATTANIHNSDEKGEDTTKTTASVNDDAANRESSIDIIDAQPSQSLTESVITSSTEALSGTSNGYFTAAPVAKAVSTTATNQNYKPVVCYKRNAQVGILNSDTQKIERWGKMIGHAGQKILVSFSKGSPQWYKKSQLRILEQQSDSNKSSKRNNKKGFRELIQQCG